MDGLGLQLRVQATLTTLTADVTKSSAIEGEFLNQDQVRSSIARKLGLDVGGMVSSSRDIDGIVEMMLDATQNFHQSLTSDRLFAWQSALFPTGRSDLVRITVGSWRTAESGPMQVVSGAMGRERVHFEAPAVERIPQEMERFLIVANMPGSGKATFFQKMVLPYMLSAFLQVPRTLALGPAQVRHSSCFGSKITGHKSFLTEKLRKHN